MVFFPGFCEKNGHSAPIHKIWFCLFLRTPNIVKDMKNFFILPPPSYYGKHRFQKQRIHITLQKRSGQQEQRSRSQHQQITVKRPLSLSPLPRPPVPVSRHCTNPVQKPASGRDIKNKVRESCRDAQKNPCRSHFNSRSGDCHPKRRSYPEQEQTGRRCSKDGQTCQP